MVTADNGTTTTDRKCGCEDGYSLGVDGICREVDPAEIIDFYAPTKSPPTVLDFTVKSGWFN